MQTLIIATRGSNLALWQARHVADLIRAAWPDTGEIRLLPCKTRGDIILDVPLAKVGGKGLFVKEIEEALLDGRADLAVHSMKDVPMELPAGLTLGAVIRRETPLDAFLSHRWPNIATLPRGARVGTSSLRRTAQLLALRPDIAVASLRGNVNTRLDKLAAGEFDAVIVAAAGIRRLGLSAPFLAELPPETMLPAAGQGALGVECREDRQDLLAMLARLDHAPTRLAVWAERGLLAGLDGGCQAPIAAHAALCGNELALTALLMSPDGCRAIRGGDVLAADASPAEARAMGMGLAATFRRSGGDALLAELLASRG